MKTLSFYLVMVVMMLAGLEALSLAVYWSRLVLPEPIYRPEYFRCEGCKTIFSDEAKQLPPDAFLGWGYYDPEIGWNSYRNGKRVGPANLASCGAAFGDSFTHADEVNDDEAWPFQLSHLLGCEVENFGVGGYGQDQAYVKYIKYRPAGRFVVIGINEETLRRNFAASWRYYGGLRNTLPKPIFTLNDGELVLHKSPPHLDPDLIASHHVFDRYAEPFRVGFPYFSSLLRTVFYRLFPSAYAANRIEPYKAVWHNSDAVNLSLKLLQKQQSEAAADSKRLAVLFAPTAAEVGANGPAYSSYLERVRQMLPEVCLIDPFSSLRAQHQVSGPLNMPNNHFNAAGNRAIAAAAAAAIKDCGF